MRRSALCVCAAALFAPATAAFAAEEEAPLEVRFNLAPEISRGDWSFKIIGRLQADEVAAESDVGGVSDSWNGSEIRRGRIGVQGRDGRVSYRGEVTIDEGEALWEDAWVEIGAGSLAVIVGHWKEPVSLDQQSSSRHSTSMERAAFLNAFNFGRRMGVGVVASGDRYTFKAGVFGDNVNADTGANEEGAAVAARVTFNPLNADGRIIHLGASAEHREAADGGLFRYRARPPIHISDRFVDTAAFAESDTFLGVEAAYLAGPFHVEAEYGRLSADGPLADGDFAGGYLQGGVFLTAGDSKGYRNGVFDRTRPQRTLNEGGIGAWELRGRVDWLDLDEGVIAGGTQTAYTIGVNWFATDYLRFMGEYSYADIDEGPLGSGDVNALSMRAAIDW